MKKIAKMFAFVMMMTLGTTTMLTSCDERLMEDIAESINLVGTWESTEKLCSVDYPGHNHINFNGLITFRSNHEFFDDHGSGGTWSLSNGILTLKYDRGYNNIVQFYIQDGYNRNCMKLNTTVNTGFETYRSTVTLRYVR